MVREYLAPAARLALRLGAVKLIGLSLALVG
jgi:hypothetical protein